MNEQAWSFLLFAGEIVGLSANYFFIRRKFWWGWVFLLIFVSVPWLVYSISTAKVGFILLSAMWFAVYVSNAITWKRKLEK